MNQSNYPDQDFSFPMGLWWRLWWVRPVAFGLALVIGTYAFFEVRGRMRWKAHVARITAAGGALELRKAIKNPAKEGDFWMDPFIRGLQNSPLSEGANSFLEKVDPDYMRLHDQSFKWHSAEVRALDSHYPKLSLTRRQAAEQILQKLEAIAPDFERLAAASLKSPSAFPWPESIENYRDVRRWSNKTRLIRVGGIVSLRASCLLESDHAAQAVTDILTVLRLASHLQCDALATELLTASVIASTVHQPLWDGLKTQVWDESALAGLHDTLSELLNSRSNLRDVLALEEALLNHDFSNFFSTSGKRWNNFRHIQPILFGPPSATFSIDWLDLPIEYLDRFCFAAIPSAVIQENLIYRHELNAATLLNPALPIREGIKAESTEISRLQDLVIRNPYKTLNLFPLGGMWGMYLGTIDELERIRAAVAAERYRLKHGGYPATWKDLVPGWLPSVPQDFWSGRDQIYAIDPDGRPVIYSVGENLIDEGGLPKKNQKMGDQVWRYSLPPGFTIKDFEK